MATPLIYGKIFVVHIGDQINEVPLYNNRMLILLHIYGYITNIELSLIFGARIFQTKRNDWWFARGFLAAITSNESSFPIYRERADGPSTACNLLSTYRAYAAVSTTTHGET